MASLHLVRPGLIAGSLAFCMTSVANAQQATSAISLNVDLTDAPRKLLHAHETLSAAPGPLTLVYPKWIPGEHGPTGPLEDTAGLVITAHAADGRPCGTTPDGSAPGTVKWQRDPIEMYAVHLTVPPGCTTLQITLDFLATSAPSGFSAGASTSENLAVLSWNSMVLSPAGANPSDLRVAPSITLPSAWQFGTALTRTDGKTPVSAAPTYTVPFSPVPLDQLIDSPVLAGRYFREIPLAPEVTPKHFLDIAADGPEQLALSSAHIAAFSRLVREAGALYASRHYTEYHFLVTISDSVAHFGLEHHQSSDDRVAAKTFIEDDRFILAGDLLPHEFTHSWNGKYRRPAGLATGDYEKPMVGDLLWVYEGLTQYFGDVLAARAGIWTPEEFRGYLARSAATLDAEPGRNWRDLQDTARAAQLLYTAGGGWDNWRRSTDFYAEGELLWLDVDTTIRQLTNGKKSLNDFAANFHGLGGDTGPKVVPYTFEDVVASLNAVAANDWAAFLRSRLDTNAPHAPLGGIERAGYRLTYAPEPSAWSTMQDTQDATVDFWFSLGLHVNAADIVTDVLKGGPADKAGLGPGMRLLAVNGRAFTPAILRAAIRDAAEASGDSANGTASPRGTALSDGPAVAGKPAVAGHPAIARNPAAATGPPIELIAANGEYFRVLKLDYHAGERYPILERLPNTPDRLADILKPLAK
ncbi:MAG: M61 family peptidase [Acidobacteriota bacterium]|nr:M61 family peptidase [Acidobacteriota bacterium]